MSSDSPVKLAESSFPYLITEENVKPTSFITIRVLDPFQAEDEFGLEESTLFYVAGGQIDSRDRGLAGSEAQLTLLHSFAADEVGDRSRIAALTLKSLTLAHSYGKIMTFTGWLTEARFYPTEDPFIGIVKKKGKAGHENNGYPYLPPVVDFGDKLRLPLEVSVSLAYNQTDVLKRLSK
jgi:hypothetical protein